MNKMISKFSLWLIGLFFLVIFLQWAIISPCEALILFENGKEQSYLYDKDKKLLTLQDSKKNEPLTVLRDTGQTLIIKLQDKKKVYVKDNFDRYRYLSTIFGKSQGTKKVAILYIATGKYIIFWKKFYEAMEKYFLPRHEKTYFLFTDHDFMMVDKNVIKIHQDQLPWPFVTLKRFHFFDAIKDQLKEYDYIYFLNGTMLPVAEINEEIFPTEEQQIMVTLHPGNWFKSRFQFPYDNNKKSQAYIPDYEGDYYVMGGFNGGTRTGFLTLIETLKIWTDIDIKNKAIPAWHDESMLNRYLVTVMNKGERPLILLPEYAIPQTGHGWVDELRPYTKMLILDKGLYGGHGYLRSFEK